VCLLSSSRTEPTPGWWTIPAERSKNKLSHRVPLVGEALRIVRQLRGEVPPEVPHVFPGLRHKPIENPQKWCKRIRLASKMEFKLHDLRRTAASHLTGDCKVSRFTVEQVLNHQGRGITKVYDRHSYDAEKRDALRKWDVRVNQILVVKNVKTRISIDGSVS
jgi:integrase